MINYMIAIEDQLLVIRDYFRNLAHVSKVTNDMVFVDNIPLIHLGSVTFANSSSNRYDIVIVDEIAGLMYYPQKEAFIGKVDGTMSNSPIGLTLYQSTPLVGSLFQTIAEDHELTHDCSWRNFENTPDNFCNVPRILAKREELTRMGLEWLYKTEYLGIFATPSGIPFPNIVYYPNQEHASFDYHPPKVNGIDFHGEFGSVVVSWWYDNDHPSDIYAMSERRYPIPSDAVGINFSFMDDLDGMTFCEGGSQKADGKVAIGSFNAGFMLEARRYGVVAVGNDAGSKSRRVINSLKYRIHIDKNRTPLLAHDFQNATWDDPNQVKLLKDEKHPNHYLDAGLLALPTLREGFGIWGKGQQVQSSSVVQNDKFRQSMIRH